MRWKPYLGHVMSNKKFGSDRFSRFDVYWIQTNNFIELNINNFFYIEICKIFLTKLYSRQLNIANLLHNHRSKFVSVEISVRIFLPIKQLPWCVMLDVFRRNVLQITWFFWRFLDYTITLRTWNQQKYMSPPPAGSYIYRTTIIFCKYTSPPPPAGSYI